jgi:hypothetical protein
MIELRPTHKVMCDWCGKRQDHPCLTEKAARHWAMTVLRWSVSYAPGGPYDYCCADHSLQHTLAGRKVRRRGSEIPRMR